MPIKDKTLYPRNWPLIRLEILERAQHQCECDGICGIAHATGRCPERDRRRAIYFNGRVVLTTAHLNRNPKDNRRSNLRSMCQRCHLRYDRPQHVFNAVITRDARRGQLRFEMPEINSRGSVAATRPAHNRKVVGSSPTPAKACAVVGNL